MTGSGGQMEPPPPPSALALAHCGLRPRDSLRYRYRYCWLPTPGSRLRTAHGARRASGQWSGTAFLSTKHQRPKAVAVAIRIYGARNIRSTWAVSSTSTKGDRRQAQAHAICYRHHIAIHIQMPCDRQALFHAPQNERLNGKFNGQSPPAASRQALVLVTSLGASRAAVPDPSEGPEQ
jgi:hypothetical protein